MSCVQIYSIINVVKIAACASLLLYLGITRQSQINFHYTHETANVPPNPSISQCQSCLDFARINQNTFFEFGYCRGTYSDLAVILPNNLLYDRGWFSFSSHRSNVRWYLVDTILSAIAVVLLSVVLPVVSFNAFGTKWGDGTLSNIARRHHRTNNPNGTNGSGASHADYDAETDDLLNGESETDVRDLCIAWNYQIGLLTAGLLIAGGLEMSGLYLYGYLECYISPYNESHIWAQTYLLRLMVLILVIEMFFVCCWPNKWALLVFNVLAGAAALGLFILGVIMTVRQLTTAGAPPDWIANVLVWVGALHLIETPIVLFACVPRKKPVHVAHL